jgi:hypothetical protein
MPTGKLLRLPEHWKKYGKAESIEYSKGESRTAIISGEECSQ